MATTLLNPAGGVAWPLAFNPQPASVPSFFMARAWLPPAAIATTLLNPCGTVVAPQPTTVPSPFRARLLLPLGLQSQPFAAMATTLLNPAGTVDSPVELSPHAKTVPSLLSARLWE